MPPAHRRSDTGSGHACHFPPSAATGGSADVFVNGLALMRVGDPYEPHACTAGHAGTHGRKLAAGSRSVFVNGRPAGRIGDAIDCGGKAETGSGDVFIGDGAGTAPSNPAASCLQDMARAGVPFVRG